MSTEPARAPGDRQGSHARRSGWVVAVKGATLLLLLGAAAWFLLARGAPSVERVRAFVEGFGGWGPVAFGAAYAFVGATPVPVTIMAVAGGFLFGMAEGSLLSILGSTAGAWLAYWIARFLGRDALHRLAGHRVTAVEARLAGKGFLAVLVLRPVLPHWLLSYGAGLVRVPQADYLGATLLGGAPGQLSMVAVGAFASEPSGPALAAVVVSWAVVVVVGVLTWRRSRRQDDAGATPT